MRRFLLFLIILLTAQIALAQNAVLRFQQVQEQADQAYKSGHYARAFKLYQLLNEAGDNPTVA